MFGKIMSLPDGVIPLYYELLTDAPKERVDEVRAAEGPRRMDDKKRLGHEIVAEFHSPAAAAAAQTEFERVFQRGEEPEEILEFPITAETPGVLTLHRGPMLMWTCPACWCLWGRR